MRSARLFDESGKLISSANGLQTVAFAHQFTKEKPSGTLEIDYSDGMTISYQIVNDGIQRLS